MEKNNNFLSLSHLFLISLLILIAKTPATNADEYESYVKKACDKTNFPAQCFESLAPYSAAIKSTPLSLCKYAAQAALADAGAAYSGALAFSKTGGLTLNESTVASVCKKTTSIAADHINQSYHAFADGGFPGTVTADVIMGLVGTSTGGDRLCTEKMVEMKLSPEKTAQLKKLVDKAYVSGIILFNIFFANYGP